MATSVEDFKVSGLAAGFTLGFGFLTVWNAVKQTMNVKSPLRSTYVILVWLEIFANVGIGIIGWLILEGVLPLNVPVLFSGLLCWVFEIQCLMQIIINRIYVVAERQDRIIKIKWITAGVITAINITVFNIWIPAHLNPPPNEIYVRINQYWDRISKVLICLVDVALNYMFVRIVQQRLVRYHGLRKYAALVRFNTRLMILSVAMDIMLIGLMSLKNPLVYIQFHPVTYMVKLNIEMTMAALITKLARASNGMSTGFGDADDMVVPLSSSQQNAFNLNKYHTSSHDHHGNTRSVNVSSNDVDSMAMEEFDGDAGHSSERKNSSEIEIIKETTTTVHVSAVAEHDDDQSGFSFFKTPSTEEVSLHPTGNITTVESSGPHRALRRNFSRFSSTSDKSRDRSTGRESGGVDDQVEVQRESLFPPPAVHKSNHRQRDDDSIV